MRNRRNRGRLHDDSKGGVNGRLTLIWTSIHTLPLAVLQIPLHWILWVRVGKILSLEAD